jgi:hypothetical protein
VINASAPKTNRVGYVPSGQGKEIDNSEGLFLEGRLPTSELTNDYNVLCV